ncbi:MAG: family 5 extracellular solute-binding protein [Candidatus Peregrinibacteria bacterium Gr01-1014_25]|nr:MAG: family 5 extracellular solute-binding protein [Candidatus Peregrinibacteria bacterium Gr01-1014_25]
MLSIVFRIVTWVRRWERLVVAGLIVLALGSFVALLVSFYRNVTVLVPANGGTYIEGSVGTLLPLNPWFTIQNDVNRDIVSLVFCGLQRYNPKTRLIENDAATLTVKNGGQTYTLALTPGLLWHDSTPEKPHPVTADDVLFTYAAIQDPAFPNPLLRQNLQGVTVEKINDMTVQFRLEKPYSFFPSNLTLGLLPKSAFDGIPVERLDQALDFGFGPIGCGPYRLHTVLQTELSTEVTLERFDRPIAPHPHILRIVLRIFPDYFSLLSDLRNLHAIRTVPKNDQGEPAVPRRFVARQYTLPQYVALFFNLDRSILQDPQLRLGLQLGTNKQAIVDAINESVIVDTPLLQLTRDDWRYAFDPQAAQGALFASQWYFPEKLRLQRVLEQREANRTGHLRITPIALLDTGALLTLTGSLTPESLKKSINGVRLQIHPTLSGSWIVRLPTDGSSGSLLPGDNLVRLTGDKGAVLDSFYLWRTTDSKAFRRAAEEQRLVDRFTASKNGEIPEGERITVTDLTLDQGFLRKRIAADPVGIRANDRGRLLSLVLLTSPSPPHYRAIAELARDQWRLLGVDVQVQIPEDRAAFEERLLKRDYDVLLFGQSLLDNLDSYPYWHSSGMQRLTGKRSDLRLDAYNLSQYASFEADALLETVRETTSDGERGKALAKLEEIFKKDVPAVVLYSPLYTFAHTDEIKGIALNDLSLHSDRFLTLQDWYLREERTFPENKGWLTFFPWLLGMSDSGVCQTGSCATVAP